MCFGKGRRPGSWKMDARASVQIARGLRTSTRCGLVLARQSTVGFISCSNSREFLDMMTDVRARTHVKKKGYGKRSKLRKMKWCLGEAFRDVKRQVLWKQKTSALHADGGASRLFTRMTLSTADLHRWFFPRCSPHG